MKEINYLHATLTFPSHSGLIAFGGSAPSNNNCRAQVKHISGLHTSSSCSTALSHASEHEGTSWSCTQQEGFQFVPASKHSSRPQPCLYVCMRSQLGLWSLRRSLYIPWAPWYLFPSRVGFSPSSCWSHYFTQMLHRQFSLEHIPK